MAGHRLLRTKKASLKYAFAVMHLRPEQSLLSIPLQSIDVVYLQHRSATSMNLDVRQCCRESKSF